MKDIIIYILDFSKRELNGILILLVSILIFLFAPLAYKHLYPPEHYDFRKFQSEVEAYLTDTVSNERSFSAGVAQKLPFFDPNLLEQSGWVRLGLTEKQAATIIRYRAKGGRFRTPEDLKKMYAISDFMYSRLEPYVRIQHDVRKQVAANRVSQQELPKANLELNAADSTDLDGLRGIGPAFASRIIRFRNRLGGFYSKHQLLEVYGMDSLRYRMFADRITVNASLITRVSINSDGFEVMRSHPYLSYKKYNAIVAFRRQHGNFTSIDDLKKVLILDAHTIDKLGPYLRFDYDY